MSNVFIFHLFKYMYMVLFLTWKFVSKINLQAQKQELQE